MKRSAKRDWERWLAANGEAMPASVANDAPSVDWPTRFPRRRRSAKRDWERWLRAYGEPRLAGVVGQATAVEAPLADDAPAVDWPTRSPRRRRSAKRQWERSNAADAAKSPRSFGPCICGCDGSTLADLRGLTRDDPSADSGSPCRCAGGSRAGAPSVGASGSRPGCRTERSARPRSRGFLPTVTRELQRAMSLGDSPAARLFREHRARIGAIADTLPPLPAVSRPYPRCLFASPDDPSSERLDHCIRIGISPEGPQVCSWPSYPASTYSDIEYRNTYFPVGTYPPIRYATNQEERILRAAHDFLRKNMNLARWALCCKSGGDAWGLMFKRAVSGERRIKAIFTIRSREDLPLAWKPMVAWDNSPLVVWQEYQAASPVVQAQMRQDYADAPWLLLDYYEAFIIDLNAFADADLRFIGIVPNSTQKLWQTAVYRWGGPSHSCVVAILAALLFHEYAHIAGHDAGVDHEHPYSDPAGCSRTDLATAAFLWALFQKYRGLLHAQCCRTVWSDIARLTVADGFSPLVAFPGECDQSVRP